ncbi:MAG: hypothetical protein APF78_02195 [Sphingomonadales bacterium BRH_c3]|nr:MAG: hypothetical protein APF78_02195 [Sphingomonadales bacterium BRH_c3]
MSSDLCLVSLHDISREGLHRILSSDGFNILISCRNVSRIVESGIDPDCSVVIDLQDHETQMEAVRAINAAYPGVKIAILVEKFEISSMVECFDAGVAGYIVKSMSSQPLIAALRLVTLGQKVLPSELADVLSRHNLDHAVPGGDLEHEMESANLSVRERDVLCCLMAGYSNKVIARELHVCEATVKVHVKAILRKLDVSNRTQAAIWASTRGFSNYHMAA